jgi:protein ImuA
LPAGALVELLEAAEGAGAWTLALLMARAACGQRRVLVVADLEQCFYPPAAAKLGIDLERAIVIRPPRPRDAYVAMDQALRCPAVGAAIGWHDRLSALDCRRLQLAAESGGGVGFLLRPRGSLRAPSFAAVRLLVTPLASTQPARRMRIDVLRCQGGISRYREPGGTGPARLAGPTPSLVLEIDDETGDVHPSAGLAAAAAGA